MYEGSVKIESVLFHYKYNTAAIIGKCFIGIHKHTHKQHLFTGTQGFVVQDSCVMREKTPGGSFPSPSAALNPSCWRARASLASARKERGSVIDRSHSTRLFNWTLLCEGQTHVFNRRRARTVMNQKHACALTFSRL